MAFIVFNGLDFDRNDMAVLLDSKVKFVRFSKAKLILFVRFSKEILGKFVHFSIFWATVRVS